MAKHDVSVHYGDVHFPFQDDTALALLEQIVEDVKPSTIVNHGDTLDCYQISRFAKNPAQRVSIGDEIEMATTHFARLNRLAPKARKLFLQGNHEDRLGRTIASLATRPEALELLRLPSVAKALTWPELLQLEDLGWEWHERRTELNGKLILKHGSRVNKWSAYTARSEYEKYGKSGISGHTHRRGVFEHRDHNGVHGWWEHGCLCDLDPDYADEPDWQQGFLVVTWSACKTVFGVEEVRIHEGVAMFRGEIYEA
jgi:hypothetical protein